MKLFFYDLETTGVNPGRNGIHQISGMIVVDGEVKETNIPQSSINRCVNGK